MILDFIAKAIIGIFICGFVLLIGFTFWQMFLHAPYSSLFATGGAFAFVSLMWAGIRLGGSDGME